MTKMKSNLIELDVISCARICPYLSPNLSLQNCFDYKKRCDNCAVQKYLNRVGIEALENALVRHLENIREHYKQF